MTAAPGRRKTEIKCRQNGTTHGGEDVHVGPLDPEDGSSVPLQNNGICFAPFMSRIHG
jgi:hypothetical protein